MSTILSMCLLSIIVFIYILSTTFNNNEIPQVLFRNNYDTKNYNEKLNQEGFIVNALSISMITSPYLISRQNSKSQPYNKPTSSSRIFLSNKYSLLSNQFIDHDGNSNDGKNTKQIHHQRKKNHPTTYEETSSFKGPIIFDFANNSYKNITLNNHEDGNQKDWWEIQSSSNNHGVSTSEQRVRLSHYFTYMNDRHNLNNDNIYNINNNDPNQKFPPLSPNTPTKVMLTKIIQYLAYKNAPIDVKEVAESVEFYLRTRKRILGAAKVEFQKINDNMTIGTNGHTDNNRNQLHIYDLCSGHGFTGMLYAACNPPKLLSYNNTEPTNNSKNQKQRQDEYFIIQCILVDKTQPPSYFILRDLLYDICPWMKEYNMVRFMTSTLDKLRNSYNCVGNGDDDDIETNSSISVGNTINFFQLYPPKTTTQTNSNQITMHDPMNDTTTTSLSLQNDVDHDNDDDSTTTTNRISRAVISTHACGSLTDQAIDLAIHKFHSCYIAVMPCCYTGMDKGSPYGIKRAFGVSWAADIRRSFYLQQHGYHCDFSTIPVEITPMNRILVGEKKTKKKKMGGRDESVLGVVV